MDFSYADLYRIIEYKLQKSNVNERIIEIMLKKIEDDEKVKRFMSMLHACNFSIKWFMELMKLSCIILEYKSIFLIKSHFPRHAEQSSDLCFGGDNCLKP